MNDKARAAQVAMWTAIDEYARSCGGDPGRLVYGNTRRQTAVVDVERAVVAIQDAHAEELQLTPPRSPHKHDCRDCTSLGMFGAFDLYHCVQMGGVDTVIARFGDDGPEYMSGLGFSHAALVEAERRAVDAGLLKGIR